MKDMPSVDKNPNLNKQLSTEGMSFMLKIFT